MDWFKRGVAMSGKWVQAWGQAHSALSFFYYPSCEKTYRMVVKSPIQGRKIKLELSNECAKNDVEIGSVTVEEGVSENLLVHLMSAAIGIFAIVSLSLMLSLGGLLYASMNYLARM